MDFVVLRAGSQQVVGGQSKSGVDIQHRWGLLEPVHAHQTAERGEDRQRLLAVQGEHQTDVGGQRQQERRPMDDHDEPQPASGVGSLLDRHSKLCKRSRASGIKWNLGFFRFCAWSARPSTASTTSAEPLWTSAPRVIRLVRKLELLSETPSWSIFSPFCSYLDEQQQQQRRRHGDRKKAEGRVEPPRAPEDPISNTLRLDGQEQLKRQVAVWNLRNLPLLNNNFRETL